MQIKIYSKGILKIPNIQIFLKKALDRVNINKDAVCGWGLRPTAHKAISYANAHKIPYIALEDGFIHSFLSVKNARKEQVYNFNRQSKMFFKEEPFLYF